jgi:hypothetical protein
MIDYWGQDVTAGTERQFNVVVINDTHDREEGSVRLKLLGDDKSITVQTQRFTIGALGRKMLSFKLALPPEAGQYALTATLVTAMQEAVQSVRDIPVVAGP